MIDLENGEVERKKSAQEERRRRREEEDLREIERRGEFPRRLRRPMRTKRVQNRAAGGEVVTHWHQSSPRESLTWEPYEN